MLSKLQHQLDQSLIAIRQATTIEELREAELAALGRKQGWLTEILKSLKSCTPEEKQTLGAAANQARQDLTQAITERERELSSGADHVPEFDPSLPATPPEQGRLHPITSFIREIETLFAQMGFTVSDGPQVETDWYNFTALNIPEDHPARDMSDTFWLRDIPGMVLRTHTSNVQIHTMQEGKPPFRVVSPGRVYRNENIDATHHMAFHQYEGMVVDKHVTLAQLKWTLTEILRRIVSPDLEVRFRTAYFPFTEPSLEVDALYTDRNGERKWMEMGGAGMIHPNVLENAGIDPSEWNGFAFGFGIERAIMLRYGVKDLRMFTDNKLGELEQFPPIPPAY